MKGANYAGRKGAGIPRKGVVSLKIRQAAQETYKMNEPFFLL
jgi:hypothetical protein